MKACARQYHALKDAQKKKADTVPKNESGANRIPLENPDGKGRI